jgi:hypothetical protein
MKRIYVAQGVPVLHLSHDEDDTGHVVPPECNVRFKTEIPVTVANSEQTHVGWAKLRREGNKIFADLTLTSTMVPADKALPIMQGLFPAVGFVVLQAEANAVFDIEVMQILLSNRPNVDPTIPKLGTKVRAKVKETLH